MTNPRHLPIAFTAVLALAAINSALASAACITQEWCIAGIPLKAGESTELLGKATVTEPYVLSMPSGGIEIECTTLETTKGLLKGTDTGSAEAIKFGSCSSLNSSCQMSGATITTKPALISSVKYLGAEGVTATVKAEVGALASFLLTDSTCSPAGTQYLQGMATITAPKGQVAAVEQEEIVNTGASELSIGPGEAKLIGKAKIKLTSGKIWNFG
jgi:hypothetical protein